ncbi:hypothetical protein GGR53DRAFT_532802 [Hypoxylon sp. FL1150]|nr:hypothetical protein GGR53DRAFT_532802 [Hypoxylon sp. FL1150]
MTYPSNTIIMTLITCVLFQQMPTDLQHGESPCIPISQVFHTSTGLRAVDPEEAQRLNPYHRIGRLAVGHIVYRVEGGEYQAVSIKSITQTKESTIGRVYDLSLPIKHRTYHAFGYLVDMNTPSQAKEEIVDALRKVPGSKRLGLLSQYHEMWPMFRQFGGHCINQRLNWELFEHVKMGSTFIKPTGVPIDRLARGFSLAPHHPSRLPVSMVDGYLLLDDEVQLRSTYDHRTRRFRWTRELHQQKLFEHGTVEIHSEAVSGTGVIYLSADSNAQTLPPRDQAHPFKAKARSLKKLQAKASDDDDTWDPWDQYQVTIDQSAWPPDTERTDPETPVDGGTIEDGIMTSSYGVKTYMVRFPLIEDLRQQINEKFNQNLESFYEVTDKFEDGLQSFTVAFNRAPLVPFVSDAGPDIKKKFNVGFQSKLGIDVTLPTLFQQMTFTYDVNFETLSGYLYEYDPTKRGYKGDRHLVSGKLVDSSAAEACRSRVSIAYASNLDTAAIASGKLQPAPITQSLLQLQEGSVADLMQFTGYSETQEKYGPAFICRYVGRTQKYSSKFTTQQFNNLWYWWEGNGENSLSQSEEYNDINRLSSREAMKSLYSEKLAAYLTTDPDKWAEDLYGQISKERQMRRYIYNPVPDGNNVINKECNILDALSASADRASDYFEKLMAYALKEGVSTANIEGGDQDQQYQWIYDTMHSLIVAILNGDDSISKDVREALLQDINDFEVQNGLNQQADAQKRAAAILEKSAVFAQELSGWISSVGKGMAVAFGGTAAFKWAGQAFDTISAKYSSLLPGVSKLKGIATACMAGVSLATAAVTIWGLVNNWDSMSDAQRATVIIETTRMVLDAADKSIDAFKSFKSKPATTAADELNIEALNDSLSDLVMGDNEKIGNLAQEIAGDEEYRTAMGIPDGTPPGSEEAAERFNLSGKLLKVFNVILGIGLVVAMSFSLAGEWDSMNDVGKVLGVLNIVVQGLTVLLDIVDLGVEVGLFVVTGTMSVALPILGAVLAVVGIILMLVQFFIGLFVAKQDPPDPIQDFINDVGLNLINTFDNAPEPQLSYSLSQNTVTGDNVAALHIEGVNKSSKEVTLSHTTITLYSGNDDVCLFANRSNTIKLVPESDGNRDQPSYTYVTPSSLSAGQLPTPARLGTTSEYYEYDLQVAGPQNDALTSLKNLVLKPNEKFQSVWTAVVNSRRDDSEKSTSWIEVVEAGLVDKCQMQFMLRRV